jgi:hypothetical protein
LLLKLVTESFSNEVKQLKRAFDSLREIYSIFHLLVVLANVGRHVGVDVQNEGDDDIEHYQLDEEEEHRKEESREQSAHKIHVLRTHRARLIKDTLCLCVRIHFNEVVPVVVNQDDLERGYAPIEVVEVVWSICFIL